MSDAHRVLGVPAPLHPPITLIGHSGSEVRGAGTHQASGRGEFASADPRLETLLGGRLQSNRNRS